MGYLKTINQNIYFGRRDIRSVENNINLSYFFDSKKWINLRLRNYWSRAKYDKTLFRLNDNGKRTETDFSLLDFDPDTNFNVWNLDINFEWWFALEVIWCYYTEINCLKVIVLQNLITLEA